jgi:uncharacterized metal-binding protein
MATDAAGKRADARAMRGSGLVYSCSGCSSAAQLANHLALQLDRRGVAEMSCIAGVGGDVPYLLKIARSGRPLIAIDGCPLVCAKRCLERHGLRPQRHYVLSELGVRKRYHADWDPAQAEDVLRRIARDLAGERAFLERAGPARGGAPDATEPRQVP